MSLKMPPQDILRLQQAARDIYEFLEKVEPIKTCDSCEHFAAHRVCKIANETPPAEIQAEGCPSWEYSGIPF